MRCCASWWAPPYLELLSTPSSWVHAPVTSTHRKHTFKPSSPPCPSLSLSPDCTSPPLPDPPPPPPLLTGTEWTCTKRRMLAGIITDYAFGFGYMLVAGIAFFIRDWRKLQLAISAPGFLLIFYIWVLPNSARWLLANDRQEEAIALLRKAALVNGRVFPPTVQMERCQMAARGRQSFSAADLVRTPQMRKRALILFYVWFVNVLVYYGLSLGVSRLGTDLYLTQFVFGVIEIPARSLVLLFLPFSRRLTQSAFLALGGVACLLTLLVPEEHPNLRTALAMVGKFGITASFAVIYVYSAELFPTVLRQTGIGVSSMFARMGGVLAPVINMLHTRSPSTPMFIFGTAPLLGAVLALALPETANRPLPDTVEDAETWDTRYCLLFQICIWSWDTRYCLPDLYLVLDQNNIKKSFLMHFWSLWVPMCQTRPIKHGQLIDS
ncbi:solute carrier family 22 member 13 isoform X6 [Hypomesus transpacificus]|uniref:solute carrier family 22 member 13 isoform X6 n=1 Tax=Hypomesus transpacificus TaxID=137520 RepID=UPI001F079C8E|nr:solute carrier family 22 member 13 isoform X6 [Hypomesus transpacificus]